jgi:hypothetical protein
MAVKPVVVATIGALLATVSRAVSQPAPPPPGVVLQLELPVFEVPDNVEDGFVWPSMGQSLWVTTDFYQLMHFGLGRAFELNHPDSARRFLARLGIAAADVVTLALPGALAWQHEEWHRAVMSQYGIASFNDVYDFELFASSIAVSHVSDQDLIALKRDHPADQVRLSAAGIEGNYELATNLERLSFRQPEGPWHTFLLWLLYVQNSSYLNVCAGEQSNDFTDEQNESDGANVAVRDFTGLDCDGWVYDLSRPTEPYQARGVHPSGVGIDRYRKWSQLTSAERQLLELQFGLSFLNFLDPHLLGFNRFEANVGGAPLYWNASVRHQQTASGYVIALNGAVGLSARSAAAANGTVGLSARSAAAANGTVGWANSSLFLSAAAYVSRALVLPGVDVYWLAPPLTLGEVPVSIAARVALWLQPEDLRYDAAQAAPGGLLSLRWTLASLPPLQPYLEVEGKSAGWVAGNVHLGGQASTRVGLVSQWY